ncbi:MAG: lipid A export permease/ATP-binding protein MsbA [Pelistega sp.]|nr:lipid A export permease/ATP-binding protein MsbA [Pelistega sp.]
MRSVDPKLWLRLYERVGSYWKYLLISFFFTMIAAATQPGLAYLMKPLLDEGFLGNQPEYVWMIPVAMVVLIFFRGIGNFAGEYLMAWVANHVLLGIRRDMFTSLMRLPDSEFQKGDTGRLLNRFTVDAGNATSTAAEVITVLVRESFVVVALFAMLLWLSWQLTLIIILIFPISILVARFFARRLRMINRRTIDINAEMTAVVKEGIEGQRVIKMYDGFAYESARFDKANNTLRRYYMRSVVAEAAMSPITQFIISIAVSIIVFVALYQGNQGSLSVGSFISFITALGQVFDPVKRLINIWAKAQQMMMATESVFKLIDAPKEEAEGKRAVTIDKDSTIEFRDVSFRFPGAETDTIKNLNLQVKMGETIAFVGRSGSGKTTLVNMLPRFVDPTGGQILLNDVALNDYDLASLRMQQALVSQHVYLFEGTLAENVAYGIADNVSHERIMQVLEAANLRDFVEGLPQGLETQIGENGAWLSGGQRQRIAIARALLKDSPILILDEATSALDNESEKLVQSSLERLMQGRTTFMIAHRLSTIQNADRILVLDEGKIIEEGTHEELLKLGGLYSSLALLAQKTDKASIN